MASSSKANFLVLLLMIQNAKANEDIQSYYEFKSGYEIKGALYQVHDSQFKCAAACSRMDDKCAGYIFESQDICKLIPGLKQNSEAKQLFNVKVYYCGPFDNSLVMKEYGEFCRIFLHLVGNELKGTSWERCYVASQNAYRTDKFHWSCDNKGPTITLVRSNGGHIFGGYTDLIWQGNRGYAYSSVSYLFSVDNNQKMLISNKRYATYGSSLYGPTFGNGHDLHIGNDCNTTLNSYSNLGSAYQLPNGYTFGTVASRLFLAGSYKFSCDEYEVYFKAN